MTALPFDLPLAQALAMTASVVAGVAFADTLENPGRRRVGRVLRDRGRAR